VVRKTALERICTALERICAIGRGRPGITSHGSVPESQGHHSKPTTPWQRRESGFMASGAVLGDAGERPPEGLRAAGRDARGDQPACCNPAAGLGISDLIALAGFLG
jgi:hypothetical protein